MTRHGRASLIALAGTALLATTAPPATAAAQAPDRSGSVDTPPDPVPGADSTPRIAGFFDIPWHADSAAVVELMGPPISVARVREGLRIFNYTPWFLNRDGILALWIQERNGLVHGSYEPIVGDCTWMLRQMVRELNRRHPRLSPSTNGDVGRGGLRKDLCLAAIEDSARLTVTWEDPAGNRIRVGSRPDRPELLMTATAAGWDRP